MNNIRQFKDYVASGTAAHKLNHVDEINEQVALLTRLNDSLQEKYYTAKFKLERDVQQEVEKNLELRIENENIMIKNKRMETVLKKCIPMHTIKFLIVNAAIIAICITLLFLYYIKEIYIFEPYYLFCSLIISLTLFATASRALYDWRILINEKCKE